MHSPKSYSGPQMDLAQLIAHYVRLETALQASIFADRTAQERATLLRKSADALDRIEAHPPADRDEERDKAYFFLRRALTGPDLEIAGAPVNMILALGRLGRRAKAAASAPAAIDVRGAEALLSYVATAGERVSLIGGNYRYLATSESNAGHYGTRPARIAGVHVAELIGEHRFRDRARARIDACLGGAPQEYYHTIDAPGGERLMRCQMKPVPDRALGRVVLVYMRDVTGEVVPVG